MKEPIIVYTSSFCGHSWMVEKFLKSHEVNARYINIDKDPEAHEEVVAINMGYASVPTLVFPDGTTLTEPSLGQIRGKLNMEPSEGLIDRIKDFLNK